MNGDVLVVRRTRAVKRFLTFLEECRGSLDPAKVAKWKAVVSGDKLMFHFLLVACVDDPDIRGAFAEARIRARFFNYDLLGPLESGGKFISKELYGTLIFRLELMQETLIMVEANPRSNFTCETVKFLVDQTPAFTEREEIAQNPRFGIFRNALLFHLAKLLRLVEGGWGIEYLSCFDKLLMSHTGIRTKKYDKVKTAHLMFGLIGTTIMEEKYVEEDSRLTQLQTEWGPIVSESEPKSLNTYRTLFNTKHEGRMTHYMVDVLGLLNAVLTAREAAEGVEHFPRDLAGMATAANVDPTRIMAVSSLYLGAKACMVKILLEKYSNSGIVDMSEYPAIGNLIEHWLKYKPKLTQDKAC